MNALAHCVEVVWSPSRTPEAEAIALAGAERIVDALPLRGRRSRPTSTPATDALDGRRCSRARALQNATMGVHHGLSQLVGGRTGIPHGLANAVILPHAMRYNRERRARRARRDRRVRSARPTTRSARCRRWSSALGLPTSLSDCGVTDDDLDAVARLAAGNHNVAANPRPVSEADARAILEAAY